MFAKFILAALQNYLILQQIFYCVRAQTCICRLFCNCRLQIESNDIKEESAANSIFIILPKTKEVLNALDTIWQCLQCEGTDMETLFCLEKQIQESMQNNITQATIAQYFT